MLVQSAAHRREIANGSAILHLVTNQRQGQVPEKQMHIAVAAGQ